MSVLDDFDWLHDKTICCHEQRSVSVYTNAKNGIVIRAERSWDEEEDAFVIIQRGCIGAFLRSVLQAARDAAEAEGDDPNQYPEVPADLLACTARAKPKTRPVQEPLVLTGGGKPANGAGG